MKKALGKAPSFLLDRAGAGYGPLANADFIWAELSKKAPEGFSFLFGMRGKMSRFPAIVRF